ncbi:MAG: hypothetical protein JW900_11430 [Anaerolineae bacterium]|nr:hypothetical protein [Anaerolineae bacterium]
MPFSTPWNADQQQRLLRWAIPLATLLGLLLYLGWAQAGGAAGFPLDDAWIHQTYARNLAEYGEWSFVPGQPSAGSTSPAWTLLLAVGYGLRLPFRPWAYLLGGLCLLGTAFLAARLAACLFPNRWAAPLAAGLLCAMEWHLVWAAASGMETLLFALLLLALWEQVVASPGRRPWLPGLLGGLLVLTRPEGIVAVAWTALLLFLGPALEKRWPAGLRAALWLGVGSGLVVAPYLALNIHLSGAPWPNTFYAKQAEYAVLLAQPLLGRLLGSIEAGGRFSPGVATVGWIGGQVLLLPGLAWTVFQAARRGRRNLGGERLAWWAPLLWAGTMVGVYALRLPVTYQHGRYLIPVIPVLVVYGAGGTLQLLSQRRFPRLLGRALLLSMAVLFLAFWLQGAGAYAADVAIIEGEMVAVARWLNGHAAPDALIAVHDIGAVGYFARRPLLDLAGLVSPEVVPFIRDEAALLDWIVTQGADYLVTFPSWYPAMTADPRLVAVYRTHTALTVAQGGDNMVVYALPDGSPLLPTRTCPLPAAMVE